MARTESEVVAILPATEPERQAKYRIVGDSVTPPAAADRRRQARKDRDKVVYAVSWRRLGGVTQVVTPDAEDLPVHTRLTHSQKVAQVATSIADHIFRQPEDVQELVQTLGGLDLHMVEFAALAHDLGHPPFGHVGEAVLDDFAISIGLDDGFEGNAQTLRTLATLARWTPQSRGLPISAGSFASVMKYPWKRGGEQSGPLPTELPERRQEASRRASAEPQARYWKKFGAYEPELGNLSAARRGWAPSIPDGVDPQTLEATVMDIADDITYAIHDFEDFIMSGVVEMRDALYEAGAFTRNATETGFHRIAETLERKYPEYYRPTDYAQAVRRVRELMDSVYRPEGQAGTRHVLAEAEAAYAISNLLNELIPSVYVSEEPLWRGGPFIALKHPEWHLVQLMKEVLLEYILYDPRVAIQQRAAAQLLGELAGSLYEFAIADPARLPYRLRHMLRYSDLEQDGLIAKSVRQAYSARGLPADGPGDADHRRGLGTPERLLVDYLAQLTDHGMRSLHSRLSGANIEGIANGAI